MKKKTQKKVCEKPGLKIESIFLRKMMYYKKGQNFISARKKKSYKRHLCRKR